MYEIYWKCKYTKTETNTFLNVIPSLGVNSTTKVEANTVQNIQECGPVGKNHMNWQAWNTAQLWDSWWRTIHVCCCCIRDKMKRITVIILQALLIMLYQISCSVPWLGRVVYVNKLFQLPWASVSLRSSLSPGTHILCGSDKRDLWRQYRQTAWTCNWWETVNQ